MKIVLKIFQFIVITAVIFGAFYYFQDEISNARKSFERRYLPCYRPIVYSLGEIDAKFGLSENEIIETLAKAERIWEQAAGKDLFNYEPAGALTINFIYDDRQQTTDRLDNLGSGIKDNQARYESLKIQYESEKEAFETDKLKLEKDIAAFDRQKAEYEQTVADYNQSGGAPPAEFSRLEKERADLNKQADEINRAQKALAGRASEVNETAGMINNLIHKLNLNVADYNKIGEETAGEWQEGEYVSGAEGEKINVYQFSDQAMLIRLLAHEFGHALGLDHLENPDALMYRLNQSGKESISDDDVVVLKEFCKLK